MQKENFTLALYGIKDRLQNEYPSFVHDHNLCLMHNGSVIQSLHLERFTRRKYDNRLDEFIEDLLDNGVIDIPEETDFVLVNSFAGNSFISKSGRLRLESGLNKAITNDVEEVFGFFQRSKGYGSVLNSYLISQELAHVFSNVPFFGMFKDNSLLIHFDGGASISNFSAFIFRNGKIEVIEYHWELSYLSKFFNDNSFMFKVLNSRSSEHCSVPGKLMGYSSLGSYDKKIEIWLKRNNYFREYWSNPQDILVEIEKKFGSAIKDFDNKEPFFQNVAATFQRIFEDDFMKELNKIQDKYKADYLYYSGGCALNIVLNTKIVNSGIFKDVFIPPCCNDSGLSLGAAAFLEWKKGNEIKLHSPYLNNVGVKIKDEKEVTSELIEKSASILLKGGIIGICNGYGEIGPRALGNRSLLALANSKELAKRLSMDCKKREWYRPVAPIMLKHNAEKVTGKQVHHLSKYMLLDFEILSEYKEKLQGVIHVNGTSRIQTIDDENDNVFIYRLLNYLDEKHDVLALINTSFNSQGEPIVNTGEEALNSAKRMGLDAVVVNNNLIFLKE